MESRTPADIEQTGTLPVTGEGRMSAPSPEPSSDRPDWLEEARQNLPAPGKYLAYEDAGRMVCVPVSREWTRIGRSLSAEIRFDDATVSRRHALVVNEDEGVRILDDRSLNGVFVNGRRVEWSPLTEGDEITIGRHSIYFMDTASVGSAAGSGDEEPVLAAE